MEKRIEQQCFLVCYVMTCLVSCVISCVLCYVMTWTPYNPCNGGSKYTICICICICTKRFGAARRRFWVICKKPEGGGGAEINPPGCARVKVGVVQRTTVAFGASFGSGQSPDHQWSPVALSEGPLERALYPLLYRGPSLERALSDLEKALSDLERALSYP